MIRRYEVSIMSQDGNCQNVIDSASVRPWAAPTIKKATVADSVAGIVSNSGLDADFDADNPEKSVLGS